MALNSHPIINSDIDSTLVGSSADQKGISWEKKETKIDRKIKKTKKEPQLANRHKIGGHCLPLTRKNRAFIIETIKNPRTDSLFIS